MGEARLVTDSSSVLHTRDLSFCSALAVLSKWTGVVYEKRTLMHLKGGNLISGMNYGEDSATEWLTRFQADLADGGKVILVGGIDVGSDLSLQITINQMDEKGTPSLRALFDMPLVEVEIAGAHGITVFPDGRFDLEECGGRGVLSKQECVALLQEHL